MTPTDQTYSELQEAFNFYNKELFNGEIPYCLITLQRKDRTYGYFSAKRFSLRDMEKTTDEIAMNPIYFGVTPLTEIMQTLVHEMVHAWQFHHGKPGRRGYHNKEWALKMESIGLMPSDTGKPGGKKTGEKMSDYPIEGGAFLKATEKLLKSGFQISWLDRFPPLSSVPAALLDTSEHEGTPLAEAAYIANGIVLPQANENRSNRCKYKCKICSAQVWGKPNLKIICGNSDCNLAPMDVALE